MLVQLDRGDKTDLRHALDTPRPDEDIYMASDRWISTLTDPLSQTLQLPTRVI